MKIKIDSPFSSQLLLTCAVCAFSASASFAQGTPVTAVDPPILSATNTLDTQAQHPSALPTASTQTTTTMGVHTEGNKIIGPDGKRFIPVGFNSVHIWLDETAARHALSTEISKSGANTVRLVTSGESWTWNSQSNTPAKKKQLVDLAIKAKLTPIIEAHDATCLSDYDKPIADGKMGLKQVVDHWLLPDNVAMFKQYPNTLWLNIANEWGPSNNVAWADGYKKSIERIRQAGITNMLVIDAGGCGQDANTLLKWGNEVAASDPLKKVVLSIHMYGLWVTKDKPAQSWQFKVEDTLPKFEALKAPVIIGEFGWDTPPSSNGAAFNPKTLLKTANSLGMGWLFWAWYSNKGEDAVNAVTDPATYNLTDIGKVLVNDPEVGLKALAARRATTAPATPGRQPYRKVQG